MKILLSLLALGIAVIIPVFFEELLALFVTKLSAGWVFSTIYIRILVIIFFAVFLNLLFSNFEKTRKIKFWVVFLIAIVPGFGLSFISPIYEGDYGYVQKEDLPQLNIEQLKEATQDQLEIEKEYEIIAFFTSTCPHCMSTSKKLGMNISAGQEIPVTAMFPGDKASAEGFLSANGGEAFTYFVIEGEPFAMNAGGSFPSTFLVNKKGETVNHWRGDVLNYSALDHLLSLEP